MEIKTDRVVTMIELVSPSNKRGPSSSDLNAVEIDFVRKGNWRVLRQPHTCPAKHETAYRATLRFASDPMVVY